MRRNPGFASIPGSGLPPVGTASWPCVQPRPAHLHRAPGWYIYGVSTSAGDMAKAETAERKHERVYCVLMPQAGAGSNAWRLARKPRSAVSCCKARSLQPGGRSGLESDVFSRRQTLMPFARAARPARAEPGVAAGSTPLPRTHRWMNRHWWSSRPVRITTTRPSRAGRPHSTAAFAGRRPGNPDGASCGSSSLPAYGSPDVARRVRRASNGQSARGRPRTPAAISRACVGH